ncbi:MAG: flagellin [Ilumatobacter sp.]|jgi:flagellin
MRINSNSMAINAHRNLSMNNVSLGKSLEKLSSGFRINRAADDAAGLVISQNLRAQVSGLRQATRNAQDGISVVQTAEGALNEVHTLLNRMRDLSVQAANSGSNNADARSAAQAEINALTSEINRISDKTAFGGTNLLDGSYGKSAGQLSGFDVDNSIVLSSGALTVDGETVTIADGTYTGSSYAATLEAAAKAALTAAGKTDEAAAFSVKYEAVGAGAAITFENSGTSALAVTSAGGHAVATGTLAASTGTGGQFQVGANAGDTVSVALADTDAAGLGIASLDVTTDAGAAAAMTALDGAIKTVGATRGDIGALQNRFESMINNLQVTTENLVASESRIRDTDMAVEMTNFTKSQILTQAGTSMLAQANQVPQTVLSLLR